MVTTWGSRKELKSSSLRNCHCTPLLVENCTITPRIIKDTARVELKCRKKKPWLLQTFCTTLHSDNSSERNTDTEDLNRRVQHEVDHRLTKVNKELMETAEVWTDQVNSTDCTVRKQPHECSRGPKYSM